MTLPSALKRVAVLSALLTLLLASGIARTPPQGPIVSLRVRVVRVSRASHSVEVRFTVTNAGPETIFIPVIEVPGMREPWALQLMHFDTRRGSGSLGPFYDVPTGTAHAVEPNRTVSFVHSVSDPCIVVWPGERIPRHHIKPTPLSGSYTLRIGYYRSESDWKKRLSILQGKTPYTQMPKLELVDSESFTIAPAE